MGQTAGEPAPLHTLTFGPVCEGLNTHTHTSSKVSESGGRWAGPKHAYKERVASSERFDLSTAGGADRQLQDSTFWPHNRF